jgi:serine/threonine protein kinase
MALSPGTRLGSYAIVSAIGAGGMGEVYRATDTKLGRDVALKILPESVAEDPDRLMRFEREARTLASLNHPGIVTVYSVEEHDGVHFLTMELVEGRDLDALRGSGHLPLSGLLDVAIQVADALHAAHERGVVHRDLKPANVMVTGDGRVKVLDFGLAKQTETPGASDETAMATEAGMVMGTAPYMSPVDRRAKLTPFGG